MVFRFPFSVYSLSSRHIRSLNSSQLFLEDLPGCRWVTKTSSSPKPHQESCVFYEVLLDTLWSAHKFPLMSSFLLVIWHRHQHHLPSNLSILCLIIILIVSLLGVMISLYQCYSRWKKSLENSLSIGRSIRCALYAHTTSALIVLSVLNSGLGLILAFVQGFHSFIPNPSRFITIPHSLLPTLLDILIQICVSPLCIFLILSILLWNHPQSYEVDLISTWLNDFIYRDTWLPYFLLLIYLPNLAISICYTVCSSRNNREKAD